MARRWPSGCRGQRTWPKTRLTLEIRFGIDCRAIIDSSGCGRATTFGDDAWHFVFSHRFHRRLASGKLDHMRTGRRFDEGDLYQGAGPFLTATCGPLLHVFDNGDVLDLQDLVEIADGFALGLADLLGLKEEITGLKRAVRPGRDDVQDDHRGSPRIAHRTLNWSCSAGRCPIQTRRAAVSCKSRPPILQIFPQDQEHTIQRGDRNDRSAQQLSGDLRALADGDDGLCRLSTCCGLFVLGVLQTSDRSFRIRPIFGGSSHSAK